MGSGVQACEGLRGWRGAGVGGLRPLVLDALVTVHDIAEKEPGIASFSWNASNAVSYIAHWYYAALERERLRLQQEVLTL